jgi:hypothetical protein
MESVEALAPAIGARRTGIFNPKRWQKASVREKS